MYPYYPPAMSPKSSGTSPGQTQGVKQPSPTPTPTPTPAPAPAPVPAPGQQIRYHPGQNQGPYPNPYMGYRPHPGHPHYDYYYRQRYANYYGNYNYPPQHAKTGQQPYDWRYYYGMATLKETG